MDPTDNQDELMHELICGSTGHIAPEFQEDENDGSQFLNLHYHGDEEQDISGEEEENVEEAEVWKFSDSFRHQDKRFVNTCRDVH
jgi:hypothetical protein